MSVMRRTRRAELRDERCAKRLRQREQPPARERGRLATLTLVSSEKLEHRLMPAVVQCALVVAVQHDEHEHADVADSVSRSSRERSRRKPSPSAFAFSASADTNEPRLTRMAAGRFRFALTGCCPPRAGH